MEEALPPLPLSSRARLVRQTLARTRASRILMGNPRLIRLAIATQLRLFPQPTGIRVRREIINGVPVEIIQPARSWPRRRMLYLHGGGYVFCSPMTHRGFAARLALACDASVWLPAYRLAPAHPYPAALEDAQHVWEAFDAPGDGEGQREQRLLGGDSAGGGLSLALCYRLREQGLRLPDKLYLLSPWLDLTHSGDSHQSCAELDPMITTDWIEQDCARHYAGTASRQDPCISPLFGDPGGMPPTFIQVGTHEILLDDSRRFAAQARAAGVDIRIEYGEGLWHVWPITAPFAPEGAAAIQRAGEWLGAG